MVSLYRCRSYLSNNGWIILTEELPVIKETPKGYWIAPGFIPAYGQEMKIRDYCRWVPKTAKRPWAVPTRKEAMAAFISRQVWRANKLRSELEATDHLIREASRLTDGDSEKIRRIGPIRLAVGLSTLLA